jgi:hypothetical protein
MTMLKAWARFNSFSLSFWDLSYDVCRNLQLDTSRLPSSHG